VKVLVLNGPNLNWLGKREPEVYGRTTLVELEARLTTLAQGAGVELRHRQSNSEGALVDAVQQAAEEGFAGAVVNAGAYTHTSVALRDAFLATGLPFVEVHISNVWAREPFRHHSHLAGISKGCVVGFGVQGYELALQGLLNQLKMD